MITTNPKVRHLEKKAAERGLDSREFVRWLNQNDRTGGTANYTPNRVESSDGYGSRFDFNASFFQERDQLPDERALSLKDLHR